MVNSLLLFCFCFCFCFFCHETFSLHIIKLLWRVGKLCYLVMKIINSFLTEPKFYESHSSKCFRVISEDFLRLQTIPEDCRRFPKTNVEVRPLPKMIHNEQSSFKSAWKKSVSAFVGRPGCENPTYKTIGCFVDKGPRTLSPLLLNSWGNISWNIWNEFIKKWIWGPVISIVYTLAENSLYPC